MIPGIIPGGGGGIGVVTLPLPPPPLLPPPPPGGGGGGSDDEAPTKYKKPAWSSFEAEVDFPGAFWENELHSWKLDDVANPPPPAETGSRTIKFDEEKSVANAVAP